MGLVAILFVNDRETNSFRGQRLQDAGCFMISANLQTHQKQWFAYACVVLVKLINVFPFCRKAGNHTLCAGLKDTDD